jgi:predicted dehydrogenase
MTRLVLAGAGAIGCRHLAHIAEHPDLTLAAVIDPNPDVATLTDAPVFATLNEADIQADGIVIATPTQDHETTFALAAQRGWSALVEKPIASDVMAADRMIAMAAKHGVHILTGHHRRFHPKVLALRDALPKIGQPVLANVMWSVKKPEGYFDVPWRSGADGAPVRMNVSHELDLLQFIFGDVTGVAGLGANPVRKAARVESGGLVLSFANGLIATIAFADTTPSPYGFEHGTGENPNIARTGENSMHIMGTTGAIAFPSLTLWRGGKDWGDAPQPEQLPYGDGIPLINQLDHFARVINGHEAPINDGAAGRRTLELTLEVERLTMPEGVNR